MLSALSDWVVDVVDALGYVGVALLVALENLFPPIPSEIVLPFAGFVASDRGGWSLILMISPPRSARWSGRGSSTASQRGSGATA